MRAVVEGEVRSARRVTGGYESHAFKLTTSRGSYFVKWSATGKFAEEQRGLELIRATGTLRVPNVLAARDAAEGEPGFLVQEWLEAPKGDPLAQRTGAQLGEALARLHMAEAPVGGYCVECVSAVAALRGNSNGGDVTVDRALAAGAAAAEALTKGEGAASAAAAEETARTVAAGATEAAGEAIVCGSWVECYREACLRPAIERAAGRGQMPAARRRALERFMERLDGLIGDVPRRPSLLHGDFHRGNVLQAKGGELVIIDPHPWVGDREVELAQSEWQFSFPPRFYEAYEALYPSSPGRAERRDVYLVWLALRWGGHRVGQVDALLRWYVGGEVA